MRLTHVALLVLAFSQSQATVAPAGSCKTHVSTVPVDFPKLPGLGRWKTLYGTDSEFVRSLDHATVAMTTDDNITYTSTATHVSRDNRTRIAKTYTQTYKDGLIHETDRDDQGNKYEFLVYPLAKTGEDAYLFYRCASEGQLTVDTRYIVIPESHTISQDHLNHLLSVDENYKFSGNLYKLPNEHI